MSEKIVIECKKCNGTGKIYDYIYCVFTTGMEELWEKQKCNNCKGNGYIHIKSKNH